MMYYISVFQTSDCCKALPPPPTPNYNCRCTLYPKGLFLGCIQNNDYSTPQGILFLFFCTITLCSFCDWMKANPEQGLRQKHNWRALYGFLIRPSAETRQNILARKGGWWEEGKVKAGTHAPIDSQEPQLINHSSLTVLTQLKNSCILTIVPSKGSEASLRTYFAVGSGMIYDTITWTLGLLTCEVCGVP